MHSAAQQSGTTSGPPDLTLHFGKREYKIGKTHLQRMPVSASVQCAIYQWIEAPNNLRGESANDMMTTPDPKSPAVENLSTEEYATALR